MVTSRSVFTATQNAELWKRRKNGQSAAAVSRALVRRNRLLAHPSELSDRDCTSARSTPGKDLGFEALDCKWCCTNRSNSQPIRNVISDCWFSPNARLPPRPRDTGSEVDALSSRSVEPTTRVPSPDIKARCPRKSINRHGIPAIELATGGQVDPAISMLRATASIRRYFGPELPQLRLA